MKNTLDLKEETLNECKFCKKTIQSIKVNVFFNDIGIRTKESNVICEDCYKNRFEFLCNQTNLLLKMANIEQAKEIENKKYFKLFNKIYIKIK